MDVKWKMQHYDNGCFISCLAMLLSAHGIETEDYELIKDLELPYILRYIPDKDAFSAGIMIADSNPDIVQNMLASHGLKMTNSFHATFAEYEAELAKLLGDNICAVSSLPHQHIPSKLYGTGRQSGGQSGHAVVLYGMDGAIVSLLDPSGGISRDKNWTYEQVREFVDLKITLPALKLALSERKIYILGYIEQIERRQAEVIQISGTTITQSLQALDIFHDKCSDFWHELDKANRHIDYDRFISQIMRCIKPVVLDWRTAIEASLHTCTEAQCVVEEMKRFQCFILNEQKLVKESNRVSESFHEQWLKNVTSLVAKAKAFLNSSQKDTSDVAKHNRKSS